MAILGDKLFWVLLTVIVVGYLQYRARTRTTNSTIRSYYSAIIALLTLTAAVALWGLLK